MTGRTTGSPESARFDELRSAIAANTVPGGSAYGRAAAEMIALLATTRPAAGSPLDTDVRELTRWLVATKPSMTSVRTVVGLAEQWLTANPEAVSEGLAEGLADEMYRFVRASEEAIIAIGGYAEDLVPDGATVLYHSYSGSLLELLSVAASRRTALTVAFTESRPYRESRRIAAALADTGVDLVAYSDAAMAVAAAQTDLVVVGADALFVDGSFANKVGSLPLALSCHDAGTPMHVVTELSKLYPGDPTEVGMEQRPAAEIADDDWELWGSGRVVARNQFFERVPARLVTSYVTERGFVDPSDLVQVAGAGTRPDALAARPDTARGNQEEQS
jgi:translation initiation factor 2B subunit (eIF-2B alpha/beta/delta family)